MKLNRATLFAFFTLGLFISAFAQTDPTGNYQNYSSDKLNFSYPANWKITDRSEKQIQQVNLVPESGNALIIVIAYRPKITTDEEFEQLKDSVTKPYVEKILKGFTSAQRTEICATIGDLKVPGFRISGLYNNEESMSDVFSFAVNGRFFNLVYMRSNRMGAKTDSAWENINKTLRLKDKDSDKLLNVMVDTDNNAVINTRAIKLPKPIFPSVGSTNVAYKSHISIRVTVDEKGDVISAKGVDGDVKFFPAAIKAAKEAKFTPQLVCGEPAIFSGIIVYVFIR